MRYYWYIYIIIYIYIYRVLNCFFGVFIGIMWATQCHKPTICGWFESQNGDDLGMVYGLGFTTLYNLLHPSLTYSHEKTWFQFQSYPVLPTIS